MKAGYPFNQKLTVIDLLYIVLVRIMAQYSLAGGY
jgi:hypothetical protein